MFEVSKDTLIPTTQPLALTEYICKFDLLVHRATVAIKFPCSFFVQWRFPHTRNTVSSKHTSQSTDSLVYFQDTLSCSTPMSYDVTTGAFLKKQTLLLLNLISRSRPNQVRLVGRAIIDLAKVANQTNSFTNQELQLQFCSIQATIVVTIELKGKQICPAPTFQLVTELGKSPLTNSEKMAFKQQSRDDQISLCHELEHHSNKNHSSVSSLNQTNYEKPSQSCFVDDSIEGKENQYGHPFGQEINYKTVSDEGIRFSFASKRQESPDVPLKLLPYQGAPQRSSNHSSVATSLLSLQQSNSKLANDLEEQINRNQQLAELLKQAHQNASVKQLQFETFLSQAAATQQRHKTTEKTLTMQCVSMQSQIQKLRTEFGLQQSQLLREKQVKHKHQIDEINLRYFKSLTQAQALKEQLGTMKQQLQQLSNQVLILQLQRSNFDCERQQQAKVYAKEISALRQASQNLSEENNSFRVARQKLTSQLTRLEQQIFVVHSSNNQDLIASEERQREVELLTKQRIILKQQILSLHDQIERMRKQLSLKDSMIINLNCALSGTGKESFELLQSMEESLRVSKDTISQLREQLEIHKQREQEYMVSIIDLQLKKRTSQNDSSTEVLRRCAAFGKEVQQCDSLTKFVSPPANSYLSIGNYEKVSAALLDALQKRCACYQDEEFLRAFASKWSADFPVTKAHTLQEKARMVSKEVQKFKSKVLKMQGKSHQEKMNYISLLRPTEEVLNQMVSLSEMFNDASLSFVS